MTKRNPLDPAAMIEKALGARKICKKCTPFERVRFTRTGPSDHLQCADPECGCRCQDTARAN